MPLQTGDLAERAQEGDAKEEMKGAKGTGWVWRKRERGNVLNVLEGAIVA